MALSVCAAELDAELGERGVAGLGERVRWRRVWPEPSPHCSPLSLLRKLPFGSFSGCGENRDVCGVLAALWVNHAEVVTILKVEPGG